MNITVGADPELFVRKDGIPSSAHGLIPGTKKAPFLVERGAVQVDGMALEFNIDPASDAVQFESNISTVLKTLASMVPEYRLDISPSMIFPKEVMEVQPEEALELGCEPDYNAYTEGVNPSPEAHETMRVAGGHVHVGFIEGADITDENYLMNCRVLVRQLDVYLGLPSVVLDDDNLRRSMYGKAGSFRPKSYGLEYRVLSNFWIRHPNLTRWVFNNTRKAVEDLKAGINLAAEYPEVIQNAIDLGDNELALQMINRIDMEWGFNLLEGLD